ncbi:MAG: NHL repeat-containing protein [Rhodoferax sp.]|nr:NHL repeat-containing protein [Rhodoferax sp.]
MTLLKSIELLIATGIAATMLTACGGGGSEARVSHTDQGYTVDSGLAQKGPLVRGSGITLSELTASTLQPNGKTYTFEVKDDTGKFSPAGIVFSSDFLETTALGYYYDEYQGSRSTSMVYLRGLSNLAASGGDKAVNVNVMSSITKDRIKKLVTTAPKMTFALARVQAERELLAALTIYNRSDIFTGLTVNSVTESANFMEMNLEAARTSDQILSAISGVMSVIGMAGGDVSYFINQLETDLADDGLLNNSPGFATPVMQKLMEAACTTNMQTVASNLNSFYKTSYQKADLAQWVDSSCGRDKVVDKFKFFASNVSIGQLSKSPAYVTSSDDVGQCFSVGSVLGGSGALYVKNAKTPASATYKVTATGVSLVLGLTATEQVASGYLQRFSPSASNCPSVAPNTNLTRVLKYTTRPDQYELRLFAGNVDETGSVDGTGTAARFNNGGGIVTDANGNLFVPDSGNHVIRKITPAGAVTTLAGAAGQVGSDDGIGAMARFSSPAFISKDASGNFYVTDQGNHTIRKITPSGTVTTLAGTVGQTGTTDGLGAAARFNFPAGIATDTSGNVYVADSQNHTIRKITPAGLVTTLAGWPGYAASDDGIGDWATFNGPRGIASDTSGNLYVADQGNRTVRKVTLTGVVTTLAGKAGQYPLTWNTDGNGATARFGQLRGIATDSNGNVYVADGSTHTIRKITPLGFITTIAGSAYTAGSTMGPLPGTLSSPRGIGIIGSIMYVTMKNGMVRIDLP